MTDQGSEFYLSASEQTKQQQQHGFLTRQACLRFRSAAEFLVDSLERVGGPQRFPLRGGKGQKGEQLLAGFLQALHYCWTPQLPLLRESGPRLLDGRDRLPIDHAAVVFGEFFAQPRRRLRLEIAQFMGGTALNRHSRPMRTQCL